MPDMARPQVENYNLTVKTSGINARNLVELCAPCHSRRAELGDYNHTQPDLLSSSLPSLLTEELYFADGQILEEVYVYGSFVQSKMYQRGVKCNDCHDVHSLKFHKEGNDLCLQCHRPDQYDTRDHHFHKKKGELGEPILARDGRVLYEVGEGAECFKCHMPGRNYMGIDYRNDHSIRIPRPDLSIALNTPNACRECHRGKSDKWSADYYRKWYRTKQKFHYREVFTAGRKGIPGAQTELVRLAQGLLSPGIVRATALSLLRSYPNQDTLKAFERALMDPEPLVRYTAINDLAQLNPRISVRLIAPLLYDPVKAVRIQAAMTMSGLPHTQLNNREKKVFIAAVEEYKKAMEHAGDFAHGPFNLGNMYMNLGNQDLAEKNYKAATEIDQLFYPAKVNLAMLYNGLGKNEEAEAALKRAQEIDMNHFDYLYALTDFYLERYKFKKAKPYAEEMVANHPDREIGHRLLRFIDKNFQPK